MSQENVEAIRAVYARFSEGAFRMRDELNEFARFVPRLSFGNIRGNRDRCPAHPGNQPKLFLRRKFVCELMNELGECDSLLPNNQVFITASCVRVHDSAF